MIDYMEGGLPQLMGEACANPASYNLCGPAVGWTKSSLCDVRALNRARDCMFLCAGKWLAQWMLGFFLASFPTKEHRAKTRIFLYLAGSVSWARCNYHFLFSSQLTEKFPRQKQKHIDKKKSWCQNKTQMSSALLQYLEKWTFWKRDPDSFFNRQAHLWVPAKGNLHTVFICVCMIVLRARVCICVSVRVEDWFEEDCYSSNRVGIHFRLKSNAFRAG